MERGSEIHGSEVPNGDYRFAVARCSLRIRNGRRRNVLLSAIQRFCFALSLSFEDLTSTNSKD